MKIKTYVILLFSILLIQCQSTTQIDLSGKWNYKLDKNEIGLKEKWYRHRFENSLSLPGSLRDHNIGDDPGLKTNWTGSIYDSSWFYNPSMKKFRDIENPKFPFWLTPVKRYVGMAWYQKEIEIPLKWKDKIIVLYLERPHWQTKVWIDEIPLGKQNSLSTPHQYEIDAGTISPGKHVITVMVDNAIRKIDPGINSHSITDHTQGNWNGIAGMICLKAVNKSHIKSIKLQPDIINDQVIAKVNMEQTHELKNAYISIDITPFNHNTPLHFNKLEKKVISNRMNLNLHMGSGYKLWSEFEPNLYQARVKILHENKVLDEKTEIFGMREFTVKDKHFEINGIPTFLRGTTECCVFPLTGYPPTNEEEWYRIFNICKSFGLNHMRFHSYCPPESAFVAADKAGIYLQVEGPSWAKYSTSLGNGKPIDKYLMEESKRIIDEYGNHASFCMMAYGNEPSGNYVPYLEKWVDHFRAYDPQRVFTGASTGRNWAIIENSDYIVRSPPRGLAWKNQQPENIFDYRNKTENQQKPYITFEMGQWCVFPNFKEINKYTGPLKAKNFELFKEMLQDNHMGDQANEFLMASGKLQASCYKQEIEATLRTPNLAGFQLLSLNDFSGQGTALVGALDAFWEEKGYITAKEFRAFCNEVVPLVRLPKYTFQNNEILDAKMEVANFCGKTLKNVSVNWKLLTTNHEVVDSGNTYQEKIPPGNCYSLGNLVINLNNLLHAEKLTLEISLLDYSNKWNIWVFPVPLKTTEPTNIYITNQLDQNATDKLRQGEKVLMLASGNVENGKDVVQYYQPVFWNTSWFRMRPPHTTGIFINDKHPVFNNFPTDYYSDLHWWQLINQQQVMNLKYFPPRFRPIIQPIDTWFLNRRLAMLFEANVNGGKLMVCSIDLENVENKLVARQLKKSILEYMQSDAFNPKDTREGDRIQELFEETKREEWKSYVTKNP